jgi:hypothetical protein
MKRASEGGCLTETGTYVTASECAPAARRIRYHGELCAALMALYRRARGTTAHYTIIDSLTRQRGFFVEAGPFTGMAYLPVALGSGLAPKLLGCYEEELHPVLSRVVSRDYSRLVNVGCGEGYYAVGLAMRLPRSRMHAFDISFAARRCCSLLSRLNGVHRRVQVRSRCDHARLRALTVERALVVSDCEGFENELLQPDLVPGLATSDILVELHEFIRPGLSANILSRFGPTHSIELIGTTTREPERYAGLQAVLPAYRSLAVSEGRPGPMQWAFMTPKRTATFSHRSSLP